VTGDVPRATARNVSVCARLRRAGAPCLLYVEPVGFSTARMTVTSRHV
jgi:hypothetical protein